jgi:hypothetical protein
MEGLACQAFQRHAFAAGIKSDAHASRRLARPIKGIQVTSSHSLKPD